MRDLIFLLYQLKPPLVKQHENDEEDSIERDIQNSGKEHYNKQAKYIYNLERGIVIKKLIALQLLEGLKIKPYDTGNDRNIHFSDVFRCLIKRVLIERGIEYKLGQTLNMKFKHYWYAKFKDCKKDKRGNLTVQKYYAGIIITAWARNIINKQKKVKFRIRNDAKIKRNKILRDKANKRFKEESAEPK